MFFLTLVIFLPLLEIVGFVVIGGRIGLGLSLLWLFIDVMVGLALLRTLADRPLRSARNPADPDAAALEDMFDGFCILAGALLLIFPGFVSDFLALPLLLPPLRHLLFLYLKNSHDGVFDHIHTTSQSFSYWHTTGDAGPQAKPQPRDAKTIEGEFRNVEDEKKLQ